MAIVPHRPPTRWTPTTSSESSTFSLYFRPTARAHSAPAMAPTRMAPTGLTEEHDGVMATRPATTPDAAPSEVACPSRSRSVASQVRQAAAVATIVLTNTVEAALFAVTADPALNPNHPNHS